MPTPPHFGQEDYAQALGRLMPQGIVWRLDPNAILARSLGALAPVYERSTNDAAALLIDINPSTTDFLLPEWEKSLGLPDPCTVSTPTTSQRKASVRAKFGARGSLTKDYFISLALDLGFVITIDEFSPFRVDQPVDQPIYGPDWAFAWRVNAPAITTHYFTVDQSSADDPLETWDNTELACRIRRDAPAETIVFFAFS